MRNIIKRGEVPPDLLLAAILALATLAFTLTLLSELPVRIPLGLAMVLFVPGYNSLLPFFPKKQILKG